MKIPPLAALLLLSTTALAQIPADVNLQPVAGISGLNSPLGLNHAGDGSGRIFIVEQGGTVRVIDEDGELLTTPFVDLGERVSSGGERGLLDIAFHPEYSGNGRFYLHYSAGPNRPSGTASGDTIVAEFTDNGNFQEPVTAPGRIILIVTQDFSNHNGGQMRFGPDGYLYLGLGDGGSGGDPCNRAQTLDPAAIVTSGDCNGDPSVALLGKLLRIDIDNPTPGGENTNLCGVGSGNPAEYAVPPDNPFAGQSERCGEVLLYGLRNPWRWSFDRASGDLWIGDVGQDAWEEIDLLVPPFNSAENLGWKPCEGSFERGTNKMPCDLAGSVLPVLEYPHEFGNSRCSVTGGYRYRGPITSLAGRYVYADFCTGEIWFADNDGGDWQPTLTDFNVGNVRSFGEDADGNLFVIAGQNLFRFEGETELIFANGFEG